MNQHVAGFQPWNGKCLYVRGHLTKFEREFNNMSALIDSLSAYSVRNPDGSFDLEGTVDKFRGDCLRYSAARETEGEEIGTAVRLAFKEVSLGCSLNKPYLETKVLQMLNAQSANYKDLRERIGTWIQENAQGETLKDAKGEATGVQRPNSEFVIAKGKHGGVFVRADKAVADAAKEAAKTAASTK